MTVILREWQKGDIETLVLLANNKKIADKMRDIFPSPYTRKDAEEWISLNLDRKPATNFAVKVNEKLAGGCGIKIKDDVYKCSGEIGYWIGEPFWGKGIATIAISLLMDKIISEFPFFVRIYAEIFENNKASMRVLEKNGFHLESIRIRSVIKNNIIMNDHVWVKIIR
jgi:RimJ/RimL family protein N-acetyltransferase